MLIGHGIAHSDERVALRTIPSSGGALMLGIKTALAAPAPCPLTQEPHGTRSCAGGCLVSSFASARGAKVDALASTRGFRVKAAGASRALAAAGVRWDQRPDAMASALVDLLKVPVAGVADHDAPA
jgi:hypothetical protein